MTESKRDEHQRLQERTDELAGEHMHWGVTEGVHDDLERHRRRPPDPEPG